MTKEQTKSNETLEDAGTRRTKPTRRLENALSRRLGGGVRVAGVDEAGRGPLAGPVAAAAVIWPENKRPPKGLNDSKQVEHQDRERLFFEICAKADAVAVGFATAREIDTVNILRATRLAARRALDALPTPPGAVLTDYLLLPRYPLPVEPVVDGDCLSVSIAAASIVAKVVRDRIMDHYAKEYSGYSWHTNRGYGTPEHLEALERLGPSTLHRLTFAGVQFFTEILLPSRTFLNVWKDRRAVEALNKTRRPHLRRGWCLRSAGARKGRPLDPWFGAIVSRNWEGELNTEHRLAFLDEQEAEAVEKSMQNPKYIPSWLPI